MCSFLFPFQFCFLSLKVLLIDLWMMFSCKKLVTAKKQMSILQAPNVLVIQLKVSWLYSDFVENSFLFIFRYVIVL